MHTHRGLFAALCFGLFGVVGLTGCDSVFSAFLEYSDRPGVSDGSDTLDGGGQSLDSGMSEMDASPPGDSGSQTAFCMEPGLLLCMRFEGSVADESPQGFIPPQGKVAGYASGPVGQAAVFDTNSFVQLPNSNAWNATEYSLELWVRAPSLAANPANRFGLIDRTGRFSMFLNNMGGGLMVTCGTLGRTLSGPTIPTARWSHIACVADAAKMTFYVDGVSTGSSMFPMAGAAGGNAFTHIGSNEPDKDAQLVGMLDELRVFSGVRTAADIKAAFDRGMPP